MTKKQKHEVIAKPSSLDDRTSNSIPPSAQQPVKNDEVISGRAIPENLKLFLSSTEFKLALSLILIMLPLEPLVVILIRLVIMFITGKITQDNLMSCFSWKFILKLFFISDNLS